MKIIKTHNTNIIDEIIGWGGTFFIVISYAFVSLEILSSNSIYYQIFNLIGSLGIIYISFKRKVYQPAVLNIVWLFISILAIMKIIWL